MVVLAESGVSGWAWGALLLGVAWIAARGLLFVVRRPSPGVARESRRRRRVGTR